MSTWSFWIVAWLLEHHDDWCSRDKQDTEVVLIVGAFAVGGDIWECDLSASRSMIIQTRKLRLIYCFKVIRPVGLIVPV